MYLLNNAVFIDNNVRGCRNREGMMIIIMIMNFVDLISNLRRTKAIIIKLYVT